MRIAIARGRAGWPSGRGNCCSAGARAVRSPGIPHLAFDEVGRGEDALVLLPAADGDERQPGLDELSERSAEASLTRMAVAWAHGGMSSRLAAWAGLWCPASGRRSDCRIVRRGRARQKRKRACPARRGGMTACGQSDNPSPSQKQRVVRSSWSVQLGCQHRWCGHSGPIVVLPSSPLRRAGGDGPVAPSGWSPPTLDATWT